MSSGWGCVHLKGEECVLLSKKCDPGCKGCTLYGKFVFADPKTPSNKAVKRKEERREVDAKSGF